MVTYFFSAPKIRMEVYLGLAVAFDRPHRYLFSRPTWAERSDHPEQALLKILSSPTRRYLLFISRRPTLNLFAFIKKNAENTDEKFWEDLEIEYNRLFLGPYSPEAHPNESIYRNPYRGVLDECILRIREAYSRENLTVRPGFHDLPDHIVAELEFMAILCEKELEARQNNDTEKSLDYLLKQYDFLVEHLGAWASEFAKKIESSTDSVFYLSLASILRDFVLDDLENLRDEIYKQEAEVATSKVGSRYLKNGISSPDMRFNEKRDGFSIEINAYDCILCGVCVSSCPTKAFRITNDQQSIRLLFMAALCSGCEQCVGICPQQAIKLSPGYDHQKAGMERKWLEMAATRPNWCSGCGMVYSPDKMQQRVLASFSKDECQEALFETFSLCTKCKKERLMESFYLEK
ncbi:MAG: molecular chaperone TorD family protein [bacterium]